MNTNFRDALTTSGSNLQLHFVRCCDSAVRGYLWSPRASHAAHLSYIILTTRRSFHDVIGSSAPSDSTVPVHLDNVLEVEIKLIGAIPVRIYCFLRHIQDWAQSLRPWLDKSRQLRRISIFRMSEYKPVSIALPTGLALEVLVHSHLGLVFLYLTMPFYVGPSPRAHYSQGHCTSSWSGKREPLLVVQRPLEGLITASRYRNRP